MTGKHPYILWAAKHVINPITLRIAGKRFSPFALLLHKGRRSGKLYRTPLLVRHKPDGFVIALTYGPNTDWFRNIQTPNGGILRYLGKRYRLAGHEMLGASEGLNQFPAPMRPILKFNKVNEFVKVFYAAIPNN